MKTVESLRRWKRLAIKRAELLDAEKADHRDTRKKWNEALNLGLKVVKERDAALADKARMDWLCKHTEFRFSIYDSKERRFLPPSNAMGCVIRPAIDASMAKHPNP